MDSQSLLLGLAIVAWGVARLTGRLPRALTGPIPRWFGVVDVVLGLSVMAWAFGVDWHFPAVWVFGTLAVGAVLLGQLIRAVRGVKQWRARTASEDERLRAAVQQDDPFNS